MVKLKVGQKILLLFVVVALMPLLVFNLLLQNIAKDKLRDAATTQLSLAASKAAGQVDNFLGSKINTLIFQSQTVSARTFNTDDVSLNLAAMIKQDRDLKIVSLVDKQGNERVVIDQGGLIPSLTNVAESDAFKAATFLAGKEYISPVSYDEAGLPEVTIAVPLIRFTEQQDLTNLSTAEFNEYRSPDDIEGVLIARYDLSDLWQSVLSTSIGEGGYAYVVDDKGNLIAHPNNDFLLEHQNVSEVHEVEHFLADEKDVHETTSELGEAVLGTHEPITRANWAVVVEEPLTSVFSNIDAFNQVSIIILSLVAAAAVGLSIVFRRGLLAPIKQLAAGADRMGKGDFTYEIPVKTHDELGELAQNFNHMGHQVKVLVSDLRAKNVTLTTERSKLANIIESVSEGIIAVTETGKMLSINTPAAKTINRNPIDMVGEQFLEAFKLDKDNRPISLEFTKPGTYRYEEVTLQRGAEVTYLELTVSVLEHHDQGIAAIITLYDLTPGRELEKMKLDFVTIAAHELRTPLTVVKGYLSLLNTDAINQLSILNIENLQRAIIGSDQLGNLINNLLNISRIERGQLQMVYSKLDLADLCRRLVGQQKITARAKEQKLRYIGAEKHVYVYGDASALGEVVNNLVSNAMKYSPTGATIEVTLHELNQRVRVTVIDNGPGIPDEAQERLFSKFYRVERSLTATSRGTGIGLFIVKTIVEMHHGKIGFESTFGKGSTFYFTLPLYDAVDHPAVPNKEKGFVGRHGWITKRSRR